MIVREVEKTADVVPLSDLYGRMRRHAPNTPDFDWDQAALIAATEFCDKSWFARRTVELQLTATDGEPNSTYPIYVPDDLGVERTDIEVCGIKAASVNGIPIRPIRPENFPSSLTGLPRAYWFVVPDHIRFWPEVSQEAVDEVPLILITLAIRPRMTATTLPADIVLAHRETLSYGAMAWVQDIPGLVASNPVLAAQNRAMFLRGIAVAKAHAMAGHAASASSARGRPFAI